MSTPSSSDGDERSRRVGDGRVGDGRVGDGRVGDGRVEDGVEAALLEACETIRGLLAQAVRDELLARYRVGALLSVIKRSPRVYGDHPVERLAAELGIAEPTLYRYATVAECWSVAEIKAQGARTNRFGEPLSWSHLVALTKVTDAATRRRLTDECLLKGWTVRKLTQVIGAQVREGDEDDEPRAGASVRVALTEGIQNATRATVELSIFEEAFATRLRDLEGENEGADEELVARAIDAFEELQVRAESTLSQLRGASRSSEKRLRCAAPVRLERSPSPSPDVWDDAASVTPPRLRLRRT